MLPCAHPPCQAPVESRRDRGYIVNWYLKVLRQYADFQGRARRTEYWMFTLFNVLASVVLLFVDSLLGTGNFTGGTGAAGVGFAASLGLLGLIYALAVLVPTLAVGVRRLHDTGRSGWWLLITLIPLVGSLVLLVFFVIDGDRRPNRHGPDPKQLAASGGY